jgi:hypothetical protein
MPRAMTNFAFEKLSERASSRPQSEMRIRVAEGRGHEVAFTIHEVDLAVRENGCTDDARLVMALRMVEEAAAMVEKWATTLGAQHVCDPWLDSCAQWVAGVGSTLVSAFTYDDGPERRVALALAAEESSMRLLMGVEREGTETVAMLKNLDGNAARAASELSTRIELADRMLHARLV